MKPGMRENVISTDEMSTKRVDILLANFVVSASDGNSYPHDKKRAHVD